MNNKDNHKKCCKWCSYCMNTDLDNNKGKCYEGIGDHIDDTENDYCDMYNFDDDLDRY